MLRRLFLSSVVVHSSSGVAAPSSNSLERRYVRYRPRVLFNALNTSLWVDSDGGVEVNMRVCSVMGRYYIFYSTKEDILIVTLSLAHFDGIMFKDDYCDE